MSVLPANVSVSPPAVASGTTPYRFIEAARAIESEVGQIIIGQPELVRGVLTCLLAGGHALLEGIPGLGKTLLVRTIGEAVELSFSRVQFTPDLMPADITGTSILRDTVDGARSLEFQPGPLFANLVLADEVNRATPKTQSALLEAMQERHVTAGRTTHSLPEPFFVLATQNPIEMEGTYPLPEAQLDRFLFKLTVPYPSEDDLLRIAQLTTGVGMPHPGRVATGAELLELMRFAREVPVAEPVLRYAVRIVRRTNRETPDAPAEIKRFARYGSSPRGLQALVLGAKVRGLLEGRFNVAFDDIRSVALAALRHRIILGFEADAEGVTTDKLIHDVVATTPEE
ncbi:MAG: AAA family ATPase [Chloroflexota bacterium]|nr:AAA family ATPase [Chloroflexota bacterium]